VGLKNSRAEKPIVGSQISVQPDDGSAEDVTGNLHGGSDGQSQAR